MIVWYFRYWFGEIIRASKSTDTLKSLQIIRVRRPPFHDKMQQQGTLAIDTLPWYAPSSNNTFNSFHASGDFMSPAFANSLGPWPDPGQQKVCPDMDPNRLTFE